MGPLDLLDHLLNFVAPASAVGLLLALLAPFFIRKPFVPRAVIAQTAINTVASAAALLAGLWFFGHDGKMASYTAMVLVAATSQWLASRAWRR